MLSFHKFIFTFGIIIALIVITTAAPQSNNLAMQNAMRSLDSARFKPNWNINGSGSGNNGRNWGAGGNVGVGTKVWQSPNGRHDVGVGANYGQQFGRSQGQSWHSRPDVGFGAAYRYKFGRR
ncbi:diptericin-D [Folsomia candida]|uniref:Diptericin-D n=1 Tax=Folsomia candida TaxID=158441 RepID=A0A226E0F8_FOLCA|nr:diptericin-D [Folsomia candida]OXA49956.1 Diptericin-D [Folsomia candida]